MEVLLTRRRRMRVRRGLWREVRGLRRVRQRQQVRRARRHGGLRRRRLAGAAGGRGGGGGGPGGAHVQVVPERHQLRAQAQQPPLQVHRLIR